MKNNCLDWHRADIRASLSKRDTNVSKLARANHLAPSTLWNAFRTKYPKGERIIAEAIGKKPEDIWPSRYQKD